MLQDYPKLFTPSNIAFLSTNKILQCDFATIIPNEACQKLRLSYFYNVQLATSLSILLITLNNNF